MDAFPKDINLDPKPVEGMNDWALRSEHPEYAIEDKIKSLRSEIKLACFAYYLRAMNPIMDNDEFDAKMRELRTLEKQHPKYSDPDSPTMIPGPVSARKIVEERKTNLLFKPLPKQNIKDIIDKIGLIPSLQKIDPEHIENGYLAVDWHNAREAIKEVLYHFPDISLS